MQIREELEQERGSVPPRIAALIEAKDVGPLVSMSFNKCKICPALEKAQKYYYLPINGRWTSLELEEALVPLTELRNGGVTGDNPNSELSTVEEELSEPVRVYDQAVDTRSKAITTPAVELTYEKQQLLEAAKKSPLSNKAVRDILKCSESKATNILSELVRASYLQRIGQGPATKYYPSGILNR